MAKGDLHVEGKAGNWLIEEEGDSPRSRQLVEKLGSPDQAWRIALYYAEGSLVDAFLHMNGNISKEEHFRPAKSKRRR